MKKCAFPTLKVRELLEKGGGADIFFNCFGGGNKNGYDKKIVIFS